LKNITTLQQEKANTLWAKRRKFKHINNLKNSYNSSYLRILKCLEKQSMFCSYCFVNTSDCISSIQNLIQLFVIVKRNLFQLWLSKWSLLELSLSIEKSLTWVFEQLVIRHYILVELSLEVQGGHDYFRFVEGTCIIVCVLSFSVLLLLIRCTKTLNSSQTLNYFRLWI